MSGSGGGPPLGVRFVSQPAECDELLFETNLASPVEERSRASYRRGRVRGETRTGANPTA